MKVLIPAIGSVLLSVAVLAFATSADAQSTGHRAVNLASAAGTKWEFRPEGEIEWQPILVPDGGWKTQGFKCAAGTYRTRIVIPEQARGKVVRVAFAAVNFGANVLAGVDERDLALVGEHINGWMPFTADVTGVAEPGKQMLLEVEVDGRDKFRLANGKFTVPEGASWWAGLEDGILRGVELQILNREHVDDVHIVTTEGPDQVAVDATVSNDSGAAVDALVSGVFSAASEPRGGPAYPVLKPVHVHLEPHSSADVKFAVVAWTLGAESYWWPNVPYKSGYRAVLHNLTVRVADVAGKIVFERTQRFGFRTFKVNYDHYELNGVHVNLRGDNQQEADFGTDAYGIKPGFGPPTATNEGWPKAIDNLLRLNFNVMRIHQIPATPYMLDVADEMGLMLVDESPLRGSEHMEDFVAGRENMLAMVRELVLRDRNHPAIVIWSAANEWAQPIPYLIPVIEAVDETRPIIADGVNEDIGPHIINMSHYVNGLGQLPVSGGHQRTDRPYGETEAVWPMDNTPQGFTWMATSIPLRRALGNADLRNYALNDAWPNYVPGEGPQTEVLERAVKHFRPTGDPGDFVIPPAINDPWHDRRIQLIQRGYSPVLVVDLDFEKANALSNKQGDWPTVKPAIRAGAHVLKTLTVFNDDLAGNTIDVSWRVTSAAGDIASDTSRLSVKPGEFRTLPVSFVAPAGGEITLYVTASKDGVERFRENRMVYAVSPSGATK